MKGPGLRGWVRCRRAPSSGSWRRRIGGLLEHGRHCLAQQRSLFRSRKSLPGVSQGNFLQNRENLLCVLPTRLQIPLSLGFKLFPEGISACSQRFKHHSQVILSRYEQVDRIAGFTHQMQLVPELVELNRAFKQFFGKVFSVSQRLPNEFLSLDANRPETFDWLEHCSMHDAKRFAFTLSAKRFSASRILYLVIALPPGDVNGNTDRNDAADRLDPGRKVKGLCWRSASPTIEQAPRQEHAKPSAQCADDKQISSADRFLHGSWHSPVDVRWSLGRSLVERGRLHEARTLNRQCCHLSAELSTLPAPNLWP